MQSVKISAALPLIKVLKVCGLWSWHDNMQHATTRFNKILDRLYRYVVQVPLSFLCIALMWAEVFNSKDLTQAGDVLYMSLTEMAFLVKLFNIWHLSSKALAYIKEIGNDDDDDDDDEDFNCKLRTDQEFEYWRREQRIFGYISRGYIGGSVAVGILAFMGVLLLPVYKMPFPVWTPFDWQKPRNYWILYGYELIAVHLTCVSNTTLDMIQCYFLFHVALLYKLVGMRLRNLQNLQENDVLQQLRHIFRLHRNVKRPSSLTQRCEELVSTPILAQILFSALVLCFTGYRLQNLNFIEDTGIFFAMLEFLSMMFLQIFLPCYYANEITVNANDLSICLYSSDWERLSIPTRKVIFLYMEFLKKPVKIKAGGFFEIGLPIFSKTINNAYSFFAILLNMEKK